MRRLALLVALLCGASLLVPTAASAVTSRDLEDAAAGWVARQMVDGEHFDRAVGELSHPDQDLTIDAVYAFSTVRYALYNTNLAMGWLGRNDITADFIGVGGESYVGPTAKLMLAAQITRRNTAAFGGVDLQARLRSLLTPSGRFSDVSAAGDRSTVINQSFAILTLARTTGGVPASAWTPLLAAQCANGGFRRDFGAGPCVSDVEATSVAVQALLSRSKRVDANKALAWLEYAQRPDGGYGVGAAASDAITTGIATMALQADARNAATLKTRAFLRSLQYKCEAPVELRGAMSFDKTGYNPALANRSTAYAAMALGHGTYVVITGGGVQEAPYLEC